MSTVLVTIEEVKAVEPHPNADKLEIVKVSGNTDGRSKGAVSSGRADCVLPARHSAAARRVGDSWRPKVPQGRPARW